MKTTTIQNEMLTRYRDILSKLIQPIEQRLQRLEDAKADVSVNAANCRCTDQADAIVQLEATMKHMKGDILSELIKPMEQRLKQLETPAVVQAEKLQELESMTKALKGRLDTMQEQVTSILTDSTGLKTFTDELSAMRTELQAVSASSCSIEESLKQLRPRSKKS